MKHTHGEKALVLALLACLSACADPVSSTVGPTVSRDVTMAQAAGSSTGERAALTKIARLVAMAIDNEPARQRLKGDMKAAPFREHKLELGTYLRSNAGRALLNRMVASNGGTDRDLFATLAAIRPLEFYMPVAKHRESWTGRAEVLVISQLDESEPIVTFDKKGREVAIDPKVAPAQPVLSIVPVETRFDRPMPAAGSRNVRDLNGDAIGTLELTRSVNGSALLVCPESGCDGGGGDITPPPSPGYPAPSIAPGLYLEFSRIVDAKEPFFRGAPEIEVHIQAPSSTSAPTYAEDLSCSGEHSFDYRKVFDQNDGFWSGRVLLFSAEEIQSYNSKFSQGFHVLYWEDDNVPCTLKLDSQSLVEMLKSTAQATATVAIKVVPNVSPWIVVGTFLGTLFSNAGAWLLTNDDFLGVAVDQRFSGYTAPGSTHTIMDGTRNNGRAALVYRQ
jgi:hypothetical protein